MGFPGSREETATPANPVHSATVNAIQDAIVDLYANGTGHDARVLQLSPANGRASGGNFPAFGFAPFFLHGNWEPTADGQTLTVQIPLERGEVITLVEAQVFANSVATIRMDLIRADQTAFGLVGASLGNDATAAVFAADTLSIAPAHTISGPATYTLHFRCTGAPAADPTVMQVETISITTTRAP